MHPIFFTWLGTYADLVATGFHGLGQHIRVAAITHDKAYVGIIMAPSAGTRSQLAALSDAITVLPGPNASLAPAHVSALAKVAPKLQIKQGDPMRAVLSFVHAIYSDGHFDPDAY